MRILACALVCCLSFVASTLQAQERATAQRATPVAEDGSYGIHGSDLLWKQEAELRQYIAQHPEAKQARLSKQAAWGFTVGSQKSWYATDLTTGANEYLVPSTCRAVGTNCYIFVEDAIWGEYASQAVVDSVKNAFDLRTPANPSKGIFQTDVDAFGNPPDVDNDPRIIILILDIKDGFTGTGGYVMGYFYSLNEVNRTGSNKAEIYYLDANPLNLTTASGLEGGLSTMAHEFQHMIHYNYDPNEISFINEGCSLVAEVNAGYPIYSQSGFANETNHYLFDWRRDDNTKVLNDYSRAARFMTYVRDQFGMSFFKPLVASPLTGESGMTSVMTKTGITWSFADLVQNFAMANIINDRTMDAKYGYLYPSIVKANGISLYSPSYNTAAQPDQIAGYGTLYIGVKAGTDLKATFTADPQLSIKAFEVGAASKRVVDLTSGTEFSEPAFGSTYKEVYFAITNRDPVPHPLTSSITGTGASALELKYDVTEPVGYLPGTANDTICVTFDGTPGAMLDSVRVALRRVGSITGGVWKATGLRRPIGDPLAVPVTATAAGPAPTVPYPVPYPNWATIDLRSKNIDASNPFAVTFNVLGVSTVDQRVMVSKYPSADAYHSFTFLNAPSSGSPDWYFLSAGTDTVYLYHVRAYVSFRPTSDLTVPGTVAFGSVTVGTSSTKNISLHNTTTATITGSIGLPANSGFTISDTTFSIPAGSTQNIAVTFSPLAEQNYNATLTVTYVGTGSPSTVALSGTGKPLGTPAVIAVSPTALLIMKNGTSGSIVQTSINVVNNGQQTLTGSVTYSGSSMLQLASGAALSVAGGSSSLITLQQNSAQPLAAGTYQGTITITHNASGGVTTIPIELRIVDIPTTITVTKTISFAAPDDPLGYQLVSVPGASTRSAASVLPGDYTTDWRMYRDNGSATNYLTEYDGSQVFNFGAGKGFWVLSRKGLSVSGTATSAASTTGAYAVALQTGWNIIANPYEKTVAWDDCVLYNALPANSIIYEWKNGGWIQASSMIPYKAYYYLNVINASTIAIPYDPSGTAGKSARTAAGRPYIGSHAIHLSLVSDGRDIATVHAAFDSTSSTDYDMNDYFAPPSAFGEASMAIENDAPGMPWKRLMIDQRKEVGDGQVFDIILQNKKNHVVTLRADGVASLSDNEIWLLNVKTKMAVDLKRQPEVQIPPTSGAAQYQLVIGSRSFVEKNAAAAVPSAFTLSQNYPNPFNPSTTIRYGLPAASRVSMKIFNTLGQEVMELVNGDQAAGWHEVVWNANVANGMYFYRLESYELASPDNRLVQVRKMILLK
ncbi:MAG TPA: T9SS type A sorting domain-containing protein [Bacteroidota bacterium]|nr:T9SS type A sorting domain-containing protein [Bacteroidota bacterium]